MLNRMIGAARLSVETFEEVEHDRSATIQALIVVVVVAAFSGIGSFLSSNVTLLDAVVLGAVRGVAGWAVWALVTWIVGATILKAPDTEADWGQLARVTGFAQTPGLLNILIFIPVVGWFIGLAAFLWQFVAMMVGVRQALDYKSTWRGVLRDPDLLHCCPDGRCPWSSFCSYWAAGIRQPPKSWWKPNVVGVGPGLFPWRDSRINVIPAKAGRWGKAVRSGVGLSPTAIADPGMRGDSMLGRMIGAARLSVETFEEVEDDSGATIQAMVVVTTVAAFSGIGTFLSGEASLFDAVTLGVVRGVVGWATWALVTLIVGTTILKGPDTDADWGQLARVTGFAQTPGLLHILIFIHVAGLYIWWAAFLWQFVAMMVGVRQALDYTSTWRAFFVILISSIFVLIVVTPVVWGW